MYTVEDKTYKHGTYMYMYEFFQRACFKVQTDNLITPDQQKTIDIFFFLKMFYYVFCLGCVTHERPSPSGFSVTLRIIDVCSDYIIIRTL